MTVTIEFEYEAHRLVKINGHRPEYMSGHDLLRYLRIAAVTAKPSQLDARGNGKVRIREAEPERVTGTNPRYIILDEEDAKCWKER